MKYIFLVVFALASALTAVSQVRQPSVANRPFVIKTKSDISAIEKMLGQKPGNTTEEIVTPGGAQMRVAVFHDAHRVDDNVEIHDASDDIYYVLDGKATLMLGGTLDSPNEISPGEWRAKTAAGGRKVEIRKGDLVIVPRGTAHQRTVTGKGFSMILIKVFAVEQASR